MAIAASAFFLLLLLQLSLAAEALSSPYLSPSLFPKDYKRMLDEVRIFAYSPIHNTTFPASSPAALFHNALLRSRFLTADPNEAHFFYLSFPFDDRRHIARAVRTVRSDLPFWNRALGADHFYLTEHGIEIGSDRNIVELRKNSIQISLFPAAPNHFIPHKDLTLPPLLPFQEPLPRPNGPFKHLAFYNGVETPEIAAFLKELREDPEIYVEMKPLHPVDRDERMSASRFCLFFYGQGTGSIGEALRLGCVPVLISDRPVLDLPFGDVLRWSDIVIAVTLAGGAADLRKSMERVEGVRYTWMRETGLQAGELFRWSGEMQHDKDVFHTVLYQLWRRRHVIRYSAWEVTAQ